MKTIIGIYICIQTLIEDLTLSDTDENDCISCERTMGDRKKGLRKATTVEHRANMAMMTAERMNEDDRVEKKNKTMTQLYR